MSSNSKALAWLAILAGIAGAGCSNNNGDPAMTSSTVGGGMQDAPDDSTIVCPLPGHPIDTYRANLVKMGTANAVNFELVASDPAPPPIGKSATWTLKLTDANGQPVKGTLTANLSMPDHNHPVPVQPVVTFDPATGMYSATPVYFFMPGYWRSEYTLTDTSTDAGAFVDRVDFNLCIE